MIDESFIDILKSHPYISKDVKVKAFKNPYNILILDDLFKEDIEDQISIKFYKLISKVKKPFGEVGEKSGLIYNAWIYGLYEEDCTEGYDFFVSKEWKNYIEKTFSLNLNQHIAYSVHYHLGNKFKKSESGWAHSDSSFCSAIDDPNKEWKISGKDHEYADDEEEKKDSKASKIARAVAVLYYFNNKKKFGLNDGGGTEIFGKDREEALFEVEPKNNRALVFEINPLSYHGFKGANFNRSAIVHWFHTSPVEWVHRNMDLLKEKMKLMPTASLVDRWKKGELWRLDNHPDYKKFFNKSYEDLIKEIKGR